MLRYSMFCLLVIAGLLVVSTDATADVLISEVYYDHPGDDEGHEFIELFNNRSTPISLDGWSVQWGGSSLEQRTLDLHGTVPAHGYFLVGGNSVYEDFGIRPDQVHDFDFQNGGSQTDGIQLVNGNAYTDTVLYDSPNKASLPADGGWDGTSFAPDVTAGHSLVRADLQFDTDAMTDFGGVMEPTPFSSTHIAREEPSPLLEEATAPEPATWLSVGAGLMVAGLDGGRRLGLR